MKWWISCFSTLVSIALAGVALSFIPEKFPAYRDPPCWFCAKPGAHRPHSLTVTDPGVRSVPEGAVFAVSPVKRYFLAENDADPLIYTSESVTLIKPNQELQEVSAAGGTVFFSRLYKIDSFGRRHTEAKGIRKQHLLLLGCSYTFGTGVEDEDTLPARLGAKLKDAQAYNFGVGGYGPSAILLRSRHPDYFNGVTQDEGVAIYYFIDDHVPRTLGSYSLVNSWGAGLPWIDDQLQYRGPFGHLGYGDFAFRALGVVNRLGFSWPVTYSDRDMDKVGKVISAIRENYLRHFPRGKFLVVIAPPLHEARIRYDMRPAFEHAGLDYIDYSDRRIREFVPDPYIPGDGHPIAAYYEKVGGWLAADLRKNGLAQ
jgi:hypothetical protein